jgi:misacylated tRNA(Ala) deacylase
MDLAACQMDSTLRRLDARVLRCDHDADGWWAVLDDTVLYPEGGGQPCDFGTIAGVAVDRVERGADGRVRHRVATPLELGPAQVEVDWPRRLDHMQQHSAQHLLTAIANTRFGLPTTSFHLHSERCDVELAGPILSAATLIALEDAVNQAIADDRPVRARVLEPGEPDHAVRSRGLPADHQGPVRVVEIEGLDLNTCGGTHVTRTGLLESVALIGTESLRGGHRLHFLAGGRVRRTLHHMLSREETLTRLLSTGPHQHSAAVARMLDDQQQARHRERDLLAELALGIGQQLAATPGPLLHLHRDVGDLDFLGAVVRSALEALPPGQDQPLIFLTAGPATGEGVFLLVGPAERVAAVGPRVAAALVGRGGGPKGRYQGRATRLDQLPAALEALS